MADNADILFDQLKKYNIHLVTYLLKHFPQVPVKHTDDNFIYKPVGIVCSEWISTQALLFSLFFLFRRIL